MRGLSFDSAMILNSTPPSFMQKIQGWWKAAANDDAYRTAYRLTEFGLGD
jgi:hypothetical protein